jgi:hypothetical protein
LGISFFQPKFLHFILGIVDCLQVREIIGRIRDKERSEGWGGQDSNFKFDVGYSSFDPLRMLAAGKEDILKVGERGIHFTQTYA